MIIKLRQIGDVLLTVPTIRAVREHYPKAYIAVLVSAGTETMLTGNPLLDEVIVFDRTNLRGNLFQRAKKETALILKIRKQKFDLTIDLTSGDRAAILSFLSGARYRVASDPKGKGFFGKRLFYKHKKSFENARSHTIEQNLDVVRQVGIDTTDRSVFITIPEEDRSWAKVLFGQYAVSDRVLKVHIHPTSRWLFKCWRDDAMASLIDGLSEKYGAQVILTCGPAPNEMEKARRIFDMARYKPIDLIGKTTLKQLAAISQCCDLFIGVDTAPMHIAAAAGTPIIALFGPTWDENWRPWGKGHQVIKKNSGCDPTGPTGCTRTKRCLCLERISVEEVMSAAHSYLSPDRVHLNRYVQ